MIDATGAIDVYFEEKIELLCGDSEEFPVAEAKRVLEENEVKFSEISRSTI